jgi:hypothetical protein
MSGDTLDTLEVEILVNDEVVTFQKLDGGPVTRAVITPKWAWTQLRPSLA